MEESKESGLPGTQQQAQEADQDSSDDDNFEPDELYDEDEDDANEKWVEKNIRKGRQGDTDAVLNCPCCFTTVCMDCQRHAKIKTQFRAIFIENCTVQLHTRVSSSSSGGSKQQQKRKKRKGSAATGEEVPTGEGGGGGQGAEEEDEVLHPVVCSMCGTLVGVQDSDEVVHFHNVLES